VPETEKRNYAAILVELRNHQVDFIAVGGVAAALEGAPLNTFDLDIVASGDPNNVGRLRAALDSLGVPRETAPGPGLTTRFGPLDVLGTIGRDRGYNDLLPHTVEVELDDRLRVRVLDLETLISVKEEAAGEKDLAVLPIMRRTLEEKRRRATS
jgi:hypothetical protein